MVLMERTGAKQGIEPSIGEARNVSKGYGIEPKGERLDAEASSRKAFKSHLCIITPG